MSEIRNDISYLEEVIARRNEEIAALKEEMGGAVAFMEEVICNKKKRIAELETWQTSAGGCMTPRDAINCLSEAFGVDPDYAHGWHCNIAMSFVDAFPKDTGIDYATIHAAANDAAGRFMFAAFGARNTANPDGSVMPSTSTHQR